MWNLKSHTTFKKKNVLFLLPCQKWIWKKIFSNEIASDELSFKRLASFFSNEYVYKFLNLYIDNYIVVGKYREIVTWTGKCSYYILIKVIN